MANMRDVNKAIKAAFPELKIELVRADGYAYFTGDDGFGVFESINSHPPVTTTADMIRMALDTIETTIKENAAFDAKVAEDVAKFKAASEVPAGEHLVVFESSDNEKLKVLIVGGGAHHGRCIATLAVLGFAPMPVQRERLELDLSTQRVRQEWLLLAGDESSRLRSSLSDLRTYSKMSCPWAEPIKPRKNKGPLRKRDWMK